MGKSGGQKRRREAEGAQEAKITENDAQNGGPPSKKSRMGKTTSLFVRSLPANATGETLTDYFSQHFPVKHATVVMDPKTRASRGFGFVTFTDPEDAVEAKIKLDNGLLDGRRLKLEVAEPRHRSSADVNGSASILAEDKRKREEQLIEARKAPKLIVRNLPWSIKSSQDLAKIFQSFGKVKFADLPNSKGKLSGFGFVTMRGRKNAEKALETINGKIVDGRPLAVDWAVDKKTWEQQKDQADGTEDDGSEPATQKSKKKKKENKTSKPKEDDNEDEDLDEAEADLRNFMKSHMENLEDESDEDQDKHEDEEDDGDLDDGEEKGDEDTETDDEDGGASLPKKTLSTDNSSTLFVRNLPFTATDETLKQHFTRFGSIRYARIVVDKATDRPAGTGFVCFAKVEEILDCLKRAPRHQASASLKKPSVLQDETVDPEGNYTMDGRVLQIAQAVSKEDASRLATTSANSRKDKDKRRLYLLTEGTINAKSPLYKLLSPADIKMRDASVNQRKKLVKSNPALHLSLTRLAIRNLPHNIGSKELKALAREAVVGFATDVKEGRRLALSKEEIGRGGEQDREAEHHRKEKGKGVVRQAKVVYETVKGQKVDEKTGAGKSRGYGFIEYSSHRWALMGLRWLNGHALQNQTGKTCRPIVEFAIENANVVSRRKIMEEKLRDRKATSGKGGEDDDGEDEGNTSDEESKGKAAAKKTAALKLALRQRIIGRKRMMRKKKSDTRRGK